MEEVYHPPGKRPRPLIQISDDDPDIRTLLRLHLSTLDCEVLETTNGADSLESIILHKPDLIILDVMMPEFSGWELCKYVKEREEYNHTGVIMLTAIGEVNNALTSPLFGADEYMDKPFDFEELTAKMEKVLQEKQPELELNEV